MGEFNPRLDPGAEHFRTAIIATLGPANVFITQRSLSSQKDDSSAQVEWLEEARDHMKLLLRNS